jgi:hypothetical protein
VHFLGQRHITCHYLTGGDLNPPSAIGFCPWKQRPKQGHVSSNHVVFNFPVFVGVATQISFHFYPKFNEGQTVKPITVSSYSVYYFIIIISTKIIYKLVRTSQLEINLIKYMYSKSM